MCDRTREVPLARGAVMKFEVYKDRRGEFRWRLKHSNGNILATSSEGYKAKASAMRCIENVQSSKDAQIKNV